MKKIIGLISIIFICLISLCSCVSLDPPDTDKSNNENMSIASTSVAICQILDKLGYDNVIGVPETSNNLPDRYKNLKTIGVPMTPDYEIIKSLSPDIVLSPKSLENSLSKDYTAAGINSAFLDLSSVEGMYKAITSLGKLLHRESEAAALVAEYENYMSEYKVNTGEQPNILLLMAFPDGFYLVSTENSYVGNLVKLAGGKNVYDQTYQGNENGFVSINPEDIVQKNPDMILVYAHYAEDDAFAFMENEFKTNTSWQYYDAVKKNNIHYLPSKYFGMSATLSWTEGLDYLKPVLYGE